MKLRLDGRLGEADRIHRQQYDPPELKQRIRESFQPVDLLPVVTGVNEIIYGKDGLRTDKFSPYYAVCSELMELYPQLKAPAPVVHGSVVS